MNTRAKAVRRQQAKAWAKEYSGNRMIHDYKRKFKIPIAAAINDLEAIGVRLDPRDVAKIRLDLHHRHVQHLPKKTYQELSDFLNKDEELFFEGF